MTNVTVYIGVGANRTNIATFPATAKLGNLTYSAQKNVYIAVVPINGRLTSNFTITYAVNGTAIVADDSYMSSFLKTAIGIIVGFVIGIIAILAGIFYWKRGAGTKVKDYLNKVQELKDQKAQKLKEEEEKLQKIENGDKEKEKAAEEEAERNKKKNEHIEDDEEDEDEEEDDDPHEMDQRNASEAEREPINI